MEIGLETPDIFKIIKNRVFPTFREDYQKIFNFHKMGPCETNQLNHNPQFKNLEPDD